MDNSQAKVTDILTIDVPQSLMKQTMKEQSIEHRIDHLNMKIYTKL